MPTTYAIPDGRTVMAATLYSGTGGTISPTNTVNGVSFQPDFVWIKVRTTTYNHNLFDSVRGVQNVLNSNATYAENVSGAGDLTAFNSNGFTVRQTANYELSNASATYVAWNWKAGGTAVSNTAGSITSSVSANTTAGFSVVTYTGTGTAATIGHGLGVAPSMIIIKSRPTASTSWIVYHSSISPTNLLTLQTTAAQQNLPLYFNSTSPTSSVFSIGSAANTGVDLNVSSSTYVAYCFAAVEGYSAFGSYTGNGSADGPFVYTGFRPRFILGKASSGTNASTSNWFMMDSARNTYNVANLRLFANLTNADNTQDVLDFTSNGFKLRTTNTSENTSGTTYIYMAFAENPFKYANAR